MCTRTARIARPRPRRSFGRVACAAAFMSARAAVTRYRKHRRKRTAKRADFGLASSMYSVLNRTRRVAGSCGRSESYGRKPKSDCRTLPTTSAGWRRWNGWPQHKGVVCPARPKRAPGVPSKSLLTTNHEFTSPSRRAGDQSDEKLVIVQGAQLILPLLSGCFSQNGLLRLPGIARLMPRAIYLISEGLRI